MRAGFSLEQCSLIPSERHSDIGCMWVRDLGVSDQVGRANHCGVAAGPSSGAGGGRVSSGRHLATELLSLEERVRESPAERSFRTLAMVDCMTWLSGRGVCGPQNEPYRGLASTAAPALERRTSVGADRGQRIRTRPRRCVQWDPMPALQLAPFGLEPLVL